MLIVMAVVVVLAAAALPSIANSVESARESNDISTLANAYTEAYSQAAIQQVRNTANSTDIAVKIESLAWQQKTTGWVNEGTVSIGGQGVTNSVATGTTSVDATFTFTPSDSGVTLKSVAIAAHTTTTTTDPSTTTTDPSTTTTDP